MHNTVSLLVFMMNSPVLHVQANDGNNELGITQPSFATVHQCKVLKKQTAHLFQSLVLFLHHPLQCFNFVSARRVGASMMTTISQLPPEHQERRTFVSCLTGLYSCWWRRYEWSCTQPGDCCCSKVRPRLWSEGSGLLSISLSHKIQSGSFRVHSAHKDHQRCFPHDFLITCERGITKDH